jgi:hypothetical protein
MLCEILMRYMILAVRLFTAQLILLATTLTLDFKAGEIYGSCSEIIYTTFYYVILLVLTNLTN